MLTAHDYFRQIPLGSVDRVYEGRTDYGLEYKIEVRCVLDFDNIGAKALAVYVPDVPHVVDGFFALLLMLDDIWKAASEVEMVMGDLGNGAPVSSNAIPFTGFVTLYTDGMVDVARWNELEPETRAKGLRVRHRDRTFVDAKNAIAGPPAFISHDSRDKDTFVRPLALQLQRNICPIWYDEFSLTPGASLRESIERGLKECGKCVVVLSPHFFANPGWSKREFEVIYQREILEGRRLMLPIWLGVDKQQVYEYSPLLLDTVGIPASLGIPGVAGKVMAGLDFKSPV